MLTIKLAARSLHSLDKHGQYPADLAGYTTDSLRE